MTPKLLAFEGLMGAGIGGFTSTRQGGQSSGAFSSLNLGTNTGDKPTDVLANRRAAFQVAGLEAEQCVFLQQVHGAQIQEAKLKDAGRGLENFDQGLLATDAAFTRQQGLALSIGHADCLAVVIADAQAGLLGVAHAGWRGALAQLPVLLAQRLVAEGAEPRRLRALLSPCISPAGLELSEDQYRSFEQAPGGLGGFAGPLIQGKFHLDLRACVQRQLLAAGVPLEGIAQQALDSDREQELLFSYRRAKGETGRMLTVAYLV